MKRRSFFGFLSGLVSFLWARRAFAKAPTIPPVTGIRLHEDADGSIWVIDRLFKGTTRPRRPESRPELFRTLNRGPYIKTAYYIDGHIREFPAGSWPLHDNPRSHMKLPPIAQGAREINTGYAPGTEPAHLG